MGNTSVICQILQIINIFRFWVHAQKDRKLGLEETRGPLRSQQHHPQTLSCGSNQLCIDTETEKQTRRVLAMQAYSTLKRKEVLAPAATAWGGLGSIKISDINWSQTTSKAWSHSHEVPGVMTRTGTESRRWGPGSGERGSHCVRGRSFSFIRWKRQQVGGQQHECANSTALST